MLSSEDEESNDIIHRRVRRVRTLFSREDRGAEDCEQQLSQEMESKEPDGPDLQKVEVGTRCHSVFH